jgi:parallel beta-helix repeat protein
MNFIINGGSSGVLVTRGGTATINNNIVQGARNGINLNTSSSARIVNNVVQNNERSGILVQENASARIGFISLDDPAASPNTIQGNGSNGINVSGSE